MTNKIFQDPEFIKLSQQEQVEVLNTIDSDFRALPSPEKFNVIEAVMPQSGFNAMGERILEGGVKAVESMPRVLGQFVSEVGQSAQKEFSPGYNPIEALAQIPRSVKSGLGSMVEGAWNIPGDVQNLYAGYEKVEPTFPVTEWMPNILKKLPGGKHVDYKKQQDLQQAAKYPLTDLLFQEVGEELASIPFAFGLSKIAKAGKLGDIGKKVFSEKPDVTYGDILKTSIPAGIIEGSVIEPGPGLTPEQRTQARMMNAASGAVTAPALNVGIKGGIDLLNKIPEARPDAPISLSQVRRETDLRDLKDFLELKEKETSTLKLEKEKTEPEIIEQEIIEQENVKPITGLTEIQAKTKKQAIIEAEQQGLTGEIIEQEGSFYVQPEQIPEIKSQSTDPVIQPETQPLEGGMRIIKTIASKKEYTKARRDALSQGLNPRKIEYDNNIDEWIYNPQKTGLEIKKQEPQEKFSLETKKQRQQKDSDLNDLLKIANQEESKQKPIVKTEEKLKTKEQIEKESKYTSEQQKQLDEAEQQYKSRIDRIKNNNVLNEQEKNKSLKSEGMEHAARKRKIIQGDNLEPIEGGLTTKELARKKKKLESNYIGKPVSVNGKNAKIKGNVFGKIKIEYENGTNEIIEASKLQPPKSPANDLKREDDIKQPETKKGTENVPENIPENIPQEDSKVKYTQDKTELQKEVKTIMDDLITTIINTEEGKNYSPKTVRLLWGRFKKTGKYEGKTGDYGTEHDYQDLAEQIGINAYGDEIMPISRNEAVQEAMNFIIQELGLSATDFSSADFASKILNGYSSKIWEGARSIEDKINEDLEEMGVYLKEQEQEYKKQTEELLQKTLNIFKKPYNKNIGIDKKTFYEKLSLEAFNYLEANTPEGLPTEFESKLYEDMFNESKKYLEPENIIKESAEDVQQPDVQGERGKGIREVEQEIPEKRQEGDKTGITQQSDLKPKDSKKLTLELKSSPEKIHAAMSEKINLGKTGRGHVFDVERQNIATIKGDIIPKEIVKLNEVKKVYEPLKKAIMDGKEILWKMDSKNPVKEPTGQPRAKDSSGYAYFDPLGFAVNKTGDIRVFGNVKIADGTIEQRSYRLDTMADVKITNNSQVMTSKMLEEIGEGAYTNAYRATELETIKAQIRKAAPEEYDRIVSRSFKNTDFDVLQNKIRDNKEIWRKLNKLYECY